MIIRIFLFYVVKERFFLKNFKHIVLNYLIINIGDIRNYDNKIDIDSDFNN